MKKITKSAASGGERGRMTGFSRLIFCAGIVLMFATCGTETTKEKNEEQGKLASKEFCDCFKTKTKDACLEELEDNYSSSVYMTDDFINAFNSANECYIELEKFVYQTGSTLDTEPQLIKIK